MLSFSVRLFKHNVVFECFWNRQLPSATHVCMLQRTGEVNGGVLMIKNPLYPFKRASTLKPSLTGWQQPEGCCIHSFCLQERR